GPTLAFVIVPDVSGFDEATARAELESAGLVPGEVVLRASRPVPAGSVIRTVPAAGDSVAAGTSLRLIVSEGPSPSPILTPSPSPILTPSPSAVPVISPSPMP